LQLNNNSIYRLFEGEIPDSPAVNVVSLDICENPLEDVNSIISEVQMMMPNLTSLRINLYDEDHVDFIIRSMVKLEYLNGLPVERDSMSSHYESPSEDSSVVLE
jgi:hypothetical protein